MTGAGAAVLALALVGLRYATDPVRAFVRDIEARVDAGERHVDGVETAERDRLTARLGILADMAADAGGGDASYDLRVVPVDGTRRVVLVLRLADVGDWTAAERRDLAESAVRLLRPSLPDATLAVALRGADGYHGLVDAAPDAAPRWTPTVDLERALR